MRMAIAAAAALGASTLIGVGAAPASGVVQTRQTTAGCHARLSPQAPYVAKHSLQAVQFVSATTGWAVGADRVLATTDGGAVWSRQRTAPGAAYSLVDAIDTQHVWVVGRHQLIRTTDGGQTWRTLPEPCPGISSVHFISAQKGFAVSGGRLLKTADAGVRWHRIAAPAHAQTVCFTSSDRGWLGAHGRVFRTVDGGRVWALAASTGPVSKRIDQQPLAVVQCSGPKTGWAEVVGPGAALSHQAHIGFYLSDSGSRPIFAEQYFVHHGVRVRREAPGPYYGTFSAINASRAVFVDTCAPCNKGTSPMAIATRGGRTFDRVGNVGHLEFASGAAFLSTSDGWVVGEVIHYGKHTATWKIVHTTDGGRTWTTQYAG
jgi:photosystem II stability/assembly factor-like uncharacterized protein